MMYRSPTMEPLESRRLLAAVYPTAVETYLVELINRARANPTAEAARYNITLNEGLSAGTIPATAKQPVTINPYLTDAAVKHSQWMIDTDIFAHEGVNGTNPGQRIAAAGYTFTAPSGWGENLAWSGTTGAPPDPGLSVPKLHESLFVDTEIPDRGHRVNMLDPDFREIGAGVVNGVFQNYNAVMLSTDFAYTKDAFFITGVAYDDQTIDDDFYTPGEGLSGITIRAERISDSQQYAAVTWDSGAYSLKVPPGTYAVTATGGVLGSAVLNRGTVTISDRNVKVDVVPGGDVAPPNVTIARPANITSAGTTPIQFTVSFSDASGIDLNSISGSNLLVAGPNNVNHAVSLVNVLYDTNSKPRGAVYEMLPPGGSWDVGDNGAYTVWLRGSEVKDTFGNAAPAKPMVAFTVAVPAASRVMISGADFNSDGKEDIAWYDTNSGQQGIWYMNGTDRIGQESLPNSPNRRLVGVGDVNGDGTAELVWHTFGEPLRFGTVAQANSSSLSIINTPGPSAAWSVAAIGDFNGDGTDDILWHNSNSGANVIWQLQNGQVQLALNTHTVANRAWKPIGAGDVNGDGRSDIIWRNATTGHTLAWFMNRTIVRETVFLPTTLNLAWRLDSVGDINGNGSADLIWRNTSTSATLAWLLNGTNVASMGALPVV